MSHFGLSRISTAFLTVFFFMITCFTWQSTVSCAEPWHSLLAYEAANYSLFDGDYGSGAGPVGRHARVYITFRNMSMNKRITSYSYDISFQDATGRVLHNDSFVESQTVLPGAVNVSEKYIYYEDSVIKKDDVYDLLAPSIAAKELLIHVSVKSITLNDSEVHNFPDNSWRLPAEYPQSIKVSGPETGVLWHVIGREKTALFESKSKFLKIEWTPYEFKDGTRIRVAFCGEDGREITVISDSFAAPAQEREVVVECKPGRYYLDVEAVGTPWTIKVSEISKLPVNQPQPANTPSAAIPVIKPVQNPAVEALERWDIHKDAFCLAMDTGILIGALRFNGFGFPKHIIGASAQPAVDYRMVINIPDKGEVEDVLVSISAAEPDISRDILIKAAAAKLSPGVFRYLQCGIEFTSDNRALPRAGLGILIPAAKTVNNRGFYDLGVRYPLYLNLGFIAAF